MTTADFKQRAKLNNGFDREIGEWKIIDIHQIPELFLHQHEVDFYCCDSKNVYLLRFRNRTIKKLAIVEAKPIYLIAELPISVLNDELIATTLQEFLKLLNHN